MTDLLPCPPPDSHTPDLAPVAEGIRNGLNVRPLIAYHVLTDEERPGDATLLNVHQCVGLAPFVGDPLTGHGYYQWFVASSASPHDGWGEYIAGSAQLHMQPHLAGVPS